MHRIYEIHARIRSGSLPNCFTLARSLEVDRKTPGSGLPGLDVLNMKMRYILIGSLFMAGCNASKLALSDNTASNISAVASYVPSGTDAAIAVKLMSDAGFTCRIERGKAFAMLKGTTPIGEVGPMDFVWCDKHQASPDARRWQVILILDEQDKVKDHSVSTGLVGP